MSGMNGLGSSPSTILSISFLIIYLSHNFTHSSLKNDFIMRRESEIMREIES
jgi:hypothetical protein